MSKLPDSLSDTSLSHDQDVNATMQSELIALVQQGVALHQQGKLEDARGVYHEILAIDPQHFDALQLLGTLSAQNHQNTEALAFFARAIAINPHHAFCYNNYGSVLLTLGRFEEALHHFDKALAINPDYAEAHFNRAKTLKELGRFDEALASYDAAIRIKPDYVDAFYNRGNVFLGLKRYEDALVNYDQVLVIAPRYAGALCNRVVALERLGRLSELLQAYADVIAIQHDNVEAYLSLGNLLQQMSRYEEALQHYDRVIAIQPHHALAHSNRGLALAALKRFEEAAVSYQQALLINPDFADCHNNYGNLLYDTGRFEDALQHYDKAVAIKTDYADAFYNRGNVFKALNRLEDALSSYEQALLINPENAKVYNNRGVVLHELGRLDDAMLSYEKALALVPDYADAYYNRGNSLSELMQLDEALESYRTAIRLVPNYVKAHWNLSLCELQSGNFDAGWREYEWRWQNEALKKVTQPQMFTQPFWRGDVPLSGKTILLYAEQGLGDTIQFCRYAKMVADQGARVVLQVQPALIHLLKPLQGVDALYSQDESLPSFDYHCALMSLPLAFNTDMRSIPNQIPYLSAETQALANWQTRLGKKTRPRIGLVWSGSTLHKKDAHRSLALTQLLPFLSRDYAYVSLQKEVRPADLAVLKSDTLIENYSEQLQDFTDTAAMCELMDLIITVDTSVAHLAGALGKKTCLLLPYVPDWRWMLEREDSPWYPTFKIYRQPTSGDWDSVLKRVMADLPALVSFN